MSSPLPTFVLRRLEDPSGISGIGVVAQGVEFTDGTVALHWMGTPRSTAIFSSIDDVIAIHGHGGRTHLIWLGADAP